MWRRPLLGIAVTSALAVAGCSSGSSSSSSFVPGGKLATSSQSPTQVTKPPPSALRPFPGKVTFEFGQPPADPQQAALAATDKNYILAYYMAIYTKGKNRSFKSFISDKGMLTDTDATLVSLIAGQTGYKGTIKFTRISVSRSPYFASDLNVNYCVDESHLSKTNIKSGSVAGAVQPAYLYQSDMFARSNGGGWKLVGSNFVAYPTGKAKECKP